MNVHAFCPHCGYDLGLDVPVIINEYAMLSSNGHLCWHGKHVRLTGAQRIICYSLMRAYPAPVKVATLLNRMDSDAEGNVVEVMVCRVRKKLRSIGAPNPIETVHNRGLMGRAYVWTARGDDDLHTPLASP